MVKGKERGVKQSSSVTSRICFLTERRKMIEIITTHSTSHNPDIRLVNLTHPPFPPFCSFHFTTPRITQPQKNFRLRKLLPPPQ